MSIHHMTNTRLFNVWQNIKRRCYTKTNPSYKYYGACGICECDKEPCDLDCSEGKAMERLYNAGYRKAADVAEEIFAEIEKSFIEYYDKIITYSSPTLPYHTREAAGFALNEMFMKVAELKKKYIGEDANVTTKESEKGNVK